MSALPPPLPRDRDDVPGRLNAQLQEDTLVAAMSEMVDRYSRNFPQHRASAGAHTHPTPKAKLGGDVVLLTGATGALGSTLLAQLVSNTDVSRVFVLNRRSPTGVPLVRRQMDAMAEAGFEASKLVRSPKVVLLETDLPDDRLGLSDEVYEEIRTSVTHIFHNAYLVNFNVPLSGFEPNVRTLRHLIDLALASPHPTPPRLLFVSTGDVWSKKPDLDGPVPEVLTPAKYATRGGYGQSKWVCEHVMANAAKTTPLRPIIVRVGQISGGRNGAWNAHEWFPAMIRSSTYLGCLPILEQDIRWIPVDTVSQAMIEMRDSPFTVHQLEHPRPVHWNAVMHPIARTLHLPLVPYAEWLGRLERSGRSLKTQARSKHSNEHGESDEQSENLNESEEETKRKNPAWTLVAFFRGIRPHRSQTPWRTAVGQTVFGMEHALSQAPCLREERLARLGGEDAVKWLEFWRRVGVLDWGVRASL
ncbi:male sterility protein-domain-containing protein [Cristinia sonorae]|uniref:Male sterility protein-domain-containing protein n=1 Tax=Cristinia sonorae TaxID=1940300 RepID=A0A8K0UV31_9AGAR|nr:male sterility protein-domain-containing protein [Cristinia sonorae]